MTTEQSFFVVQFIMIYYISQLVRAVWLVNSAGCISLYDLLNLKVSFPTCLINLRDIGHFAFTKRFWKFRLGCKWNMLFWFIPLENFHKELNYWKGSPVFPLEFTSFTGFDQFHNHILGKEIWRLLLLPRWLPSPSLEVLEGKALCECQHKDTFLFGKFYQFFTWLADCFYLFIYF